MKLDANLESGADDAADLRSEVKSEMPEPPTINGYSPMELGFRDKFENVSNLHNFMTNVHETHVEEPKSKVGTLSELPPVT